MPARDRKKLEATAHHEAGHAVASLRLHLKFKEVSIIPNSEEGSLGESVDGGLGNWFQPETGYTPRMERRLEAVIISLFAGQIAEEKYRGHHPRWGYHSDNQKAVDFAIHLASGETLNAYLKYLFLRSRDLVNTRWREIEFVAEALLERRRLTRDQVNEVIERGLGLPPLKPRAQAATEKGGQA